MRPRPLEDILSTLWIKNILPLVSHIVLSRATIHRPILHQKCMIDAEMQTWPGWFATRERSLRNLWSFAPRPGAKGVSWSVRPPEIDPLLDNTPGDEVNQKGWGKENCAAGVFRNSSEDYVELGVQFAVVQEMFVFGFLHSTSTFFCLFVCSVNWSFRTLVGQ